MSRLGYIYRRKRRDKRTGKIVEGDIWWIKYYRHGKPYRESTNSDKITVAQRLLKIREGQIAEGKLPGIHFEKVIFEELAEDYLTDYRVNGKDTIRKAELCVRYLGKFFGGMRAVDISTDKIRAYIQKRIDEGFSNASINRELAALKRMYHLGAKCTPPKVSAIPYIPMLKESNVRKGFFEHDQFEALRNALPEYLRPVVAFAYHSGWRKEEILNLRWDRVDLKEGLVRVDPGETKNEEGRTFYLNDELMRELRELFSHRRLDCPFVFHRNGQRIKGFRKAWNKACLKAGLFEVENEDGNERRVVTRIFHDLRRTAIRNMVRSGIPERVAMRISGHKSRSVFDRYNIVSDQDLREAAKKTQAYYEELGEIVSRRRGEVVPLKGANRGRS